MIWKGEVMDLNRFEDRRPTIEGRVRAAIQDLWLPKTQYCLIELVLEAPLGHTPYFI